MAKKQLERPSKKQQIFAYEWARIAIAKCLESSDTKLMLDDKRLTSIPPEIEQCTHLQTLYLNGIHGMGYQGWISDLSPLASLNNLTDLYCNGNQISDLSPLASLNNLTNLDCGYNQISDLSPLAGLSNLTRLGCRFNQISDLSPLASLSHLTILFCHNNRISDLSPLAGLSHLTRLGCRFNQISDLSPLVSLSNLTELSFKNNPIAESSEIWKYLAGLNWSECAKSTLAYLNGDHSLLPDELQGDALLEQAVPAQQSAPVMVRIRNNLIDASHEKQDNSAEIESARNALLNNLNDDANRFTRGNLYPFQTIVPAICQALEKTAQQIEDDPIPLGTTYQNLAGYLKAQEAEGKMGVLSADQKAYLYGLSSSVSMLLTNCDRWNKWQKGRDQTTEQPPTSVNPTQTANVQNIYTLINVNISSLFSADLRATMKDIVEWFTDSTEFINDMSLELYINGLSNIFSMAAKIYLSIEQASPILRKNVEKFLRYVNGLEQPAIAFLTQQFHWLDMLLKPLQ